MKFYFNRWTPSKCYLFTYTPISNLGTLNVSSIKKIECNIFISNIDMLKSKTVSPTYTHINEHLGVMFDIFKEQIYF